MTSAVTFRPVTLATQSMDSEGQLVFVDDQLVGVLVLLRDELHAEHRGAWFLEAAFGDFADSVHEIFADLSVAADWFEVPLARGAVSRE